MLEFHQFSRHPLGKELRRRVSRIVCRMAFFGYRSHALFSAQLAILHDLLALEDSLKASRGEAQSLRYKASQIGLAAKARGHSLTESEKQQAMALRDEAEHYAFAIRVLRYGRWLYRYVADGIAWRAYRFNREAIRALGAKAPVAFISGKANIDKEINLFKAIRHQGPDWLPVMHDLTNCLRTGDYSVFHRGALYRVFELKIRQSSQADSPPAHRAGNPRERRQARRLSEVLEFMATGDLGKLHPELQGGRALYTSAVERHNYEALRKAIATARRTGFGIQEPERGLLYLAWEMASQSIDEVLRHAEQLHPHVFTTLFTFRAVMPRFEQYHDSLPLTAMDLPHRDIVDLVFGRIALVTMLNYACVEAFCRERGVPLTIDHPSPRSIRLTVGSKPHTGEVREGLWDRLLLEALSLQSFTDLIRAIMHEYGLAAA